MSTAFTQFNAIPIDGALPTQNTSTAGKALISNGSSANWNTVLAMIGASSGQTTPKDLAAAVLPSQVGNSSKVLSTDGVGNLSWVDQSTGGSGGVTSLVIGGTTYTGSVNFSSITVPASTLATNVTGIVAISNGGTGASNQSGALANLGAAAASHTHSTYAVTSHNHTSLTGVTGITFSDGSTLTTASGTGGGTTYSAGSGITISGSTISVTSGTYAASSHTHNYIAPYDSSTLSALNVTGSQNVSLLGQSLQLGLGIVQSSSSAAAAVYVGTNSYIGGYFQSFKSSGAYGVGGLTPTGSLNTPLSAHSSTSTISSAGTNTTRFAVNGMGTVQGGSTFVQIAADYAEFFEWEDGNPSDEDRVGMCVVVTTNGKIRLFDEATDNIDAIVGVISGTGAVIGNSAELWWQGRVKRDNYGRTMYDEQPAFTWVDDTGKRHIVMADEATANGTDVPANARSIVNKTEVLNPEYDPTADYVSRDERPEWGIVGLLGQVWIKQGQPVKTKWINLHKSNDEATLYLISL